jgi:hypothetical protein
VGTDLIRHSVVDVQYRSQTRTVQISAGHLIPAFDVAQRNIARMAQEPSDAFSARSVFPLAARVIVVHVNELPILEWLAAHRAGVVLRGQNQVELFLSESIARNPVFPVGFFAGLL